MSRLQAVQHAARREHVDKTWSPEMFQMSFSAAIFDAVAKTAVSARTADPDSPDADDAEDALVKVAGLTLAWLQELERRREERLKRAERQFNEARGAP